jgi:hypothetical protein
VKFTADTSWEPRRCATPHPQIKTEVGFRSFPTGVEVTMHAARPPSIVCALMCASLVATCAAPDDVRGGELGGGLGAGDVDDPRTRPGVPQIVGETFDAADPKVAEEKARAARAARDARWAALEKSLRRADAATLWARAEEQAQSQNWKDAQDAYEALVVFFPRDEHAPAAVEKAMRMAFRRGEYGEGFQFFEDALVGVDGETDPQGRARLLRILAATTLAVPHWGTTRGGEYLRGRYDQGKQTQTYAEDRARAIALLEEARDLLATAPGAPRKDRVAVDMELALGVARFTAFDASWSWWWTPDNGPDDGLADAEGDDERADDWRGSSWTWALQSAHPRGLPVSPSGEVLFAKRPDAYTRDLGDTEKIKFLLDEAQKLDDSADKELAGQALLQQALLFRTRDGVERLDRLRNWWWMGTMPYRDVAKDEELYSLGDDEVLTLVATGVRRVTVPADESFPRLLADVQRLYPKSTAADEAPVLLGTYFQSRQQYPKAVAAYEAAVTRPSSPHVGTARAGLETIRAPEVVFEAKGAQAAGKKAMLTVRSRNLDEVQVHATRIDADRVFLDFQKSWASGPRRRDAENALDPSNLGWPFVYGQQGLAKRYMTKDVVTFGASLKKDPTFRPTRDDVSTPLDKPGVWLVEAFGAGRQEPLARTIVVVDQAAILLKQTAQGQIAWVVDTSSGKPIEGAQVDVFMYGSTWKTDHEVRHSKKVALKTDARGLVTLPRSDDSVMVAARTGGAFTMPVQHWLGGQYTPTSTAEDQQVAVLMTDRPVYRPGDVVKGKVWARHRQNGVYKPATEARRIFVRVRDSRGTEVLTKDEAAGQWGSIDFELPLAKGASLGAWSVEILVDGTWADSAGAGFQVEEYKAPEVKVTVKAAEQARLGDKVPVSVVAEYYSGGPVVGAKVHYKVFRQDHAVTYAAPSPWDWLYGNGYGRIWYPYRWFTWWEDTGPHPIFWYPWWGPRPEPQKELVLEGEGVIGADGELEVLVDTSAAKRDLSGTDHKYTVQAEVTDLSRHVVKGEGAVVVTRTAFLASLELEAGWARAGDDVSLVVSTLSPDGSLFPAKGALVVEEVEGVTEDGTVRGTKKIEERPLVTDDKGPTRVRWRAPKTGQYRFSFVAKDKDGVEVRSSAVAWVVGPDFVGTKYRFAGVEIVPDKRTYAPGDTARLLVSADRAGASVLLATRVDQGTLVDWKIIELPNKSTVVELPITAEHAPNFFVEAVTVADAQVFEDAREIYVPPQNSELRISLAPSATELQPGASGEIVVTTTDGQGRPVSADVALSVFDSAVLAIASDTMVDVRTHLWGRKRWHQPSTTSTLGRVQAVWGNTAQPDDAARWQLVSRAQQRFQDPFDFVSGDSKERDDDKGGFGLGIAGGAPGGGGLARRAREGEAETKTAAAPADESRNEVAAPAAAKAKAPEEPAGRAETGASTTSSPAFEPKVRSNFADTALFASRVVTDKTGTAKVRVTFPENLTTWAVKAVGLDDGARAGRADTTMVTTKKLLVRLAAPRFFRERDEVVLSAIVQNKGDKKKAVDVSLDVTDAYLTVVGSKSTKIEVGARGEARVDFQVKVRGEGAARVRVTAKAADDGDAKELTFPVLVHGMEKTVARVGSIAPGDGKAEKSVEVEVPGERREEATRLVVRTSPSLAGGMIDALPYLLEYPYGCVEQTLSRFVPAVLTKKALQQAGGIKLEDLEKAHRNLNPQQLTKGGNVDTARLDREVRRYERNPIYDTKLLNEIVDDGLRRIAKMQHGDGGWGWWSDDDSSVYMTALVMAGLLDARDADLAMDGNMIERGRAALRTLVDSELWRYRQKEDLKYVSDSDAYALWVMSRLGDRHDELAKLLFERRIQLSPYGKLLLALASQNLGDKSKASLLLENVEQWRKADPENETSWIETNTSGWWYWWNDDIETNALYLRALDAIRPKDAVAPQIVKWLLNHRKNGWYWDSTRDTAQVVAAFANHMQVSGERRPDYDLEILVDGAVKKKVHVDAKNMFLVDADLTLEGKELGGGKHTITVRKSGQGAVYFNTYLSFFTLEDDIKAEGLEVKVDRRYFKLERFDRKNTVAGDRGQALTQTEVAYRKVPLATGAEIKSGDLILVELMVTSKNDYTFLAFEDPKPAGAEAVALRSGTVFGETWAHMELRDDRVVFFLNELTQGSLKLSYRLRAELPGRFSAMPTHGFAMYAPEIQANSDEMKLRIAD